jgi:alpha-mannosidase
MMNLPEQALRHALGIPDSATHVLVLEPSAHLDWDWISTFCDYYNGNGSGHPAVKDTFTTAISLMHHYQDAQQRYHYTICEMAYLKAYLEDPAYARQKQALQNLTNVLSISGGGMTSADNLICHGEAFIRNYLLGRKWVADTLNITVANQLWIPDDFGHDAQLPVVVQAMGYQGVGFWRIPSVGPLVGTCAVPTPSAPSSVLSKVGLDFIWQAADGSHVQAHWLHNSYCEGNPSALSSYAGSAIPWNQATKDAFTQFVIANMAFSPTPYMFVPIDCDFTAPYLNLPHIVACWNACNGWSNTNPDCVAGTLPPSLAGVYIVVATFDMYMQLVKAYATGGNGTSTLSALAMRPNPYYSGCYVSHPDLKQYHYATTRALLAAEALELIVEYLGWADAATWAQQAAGYRGALTNAWMLLAPSTHHDYITGTAPDSVYAAEQSKDLTQAFSAAADVQAQVLNAIASAIAAAPQTDEQPVAVFNPTGICQSGLVELPAPRNTAWMSVRSDNGYSPVQTTAEGSVLFLAVSPSFGYTTVYLSTQSPTIPAPTLQATHDSTKNTYTLMNEYLSAEIGVQGIVDLVDLATNTHIFSAPGNAILFYEDGGNIYRFANEIPCPASDICCVDFKQAASQDLQNPAVTLVEDGALRKTVRVSGSYMYSGQAVTFTIMYALVAGEQALRITTTGTAPSGYSVMVAFPLRNKTATLAHGTAYHWDNGVPRQYWTSPCDCSACVEPMTFEATHGFVLPLDGTGRPLAAIYHASTPAWAIDTQGNLLGCILRNTPGGYNAAYGTDNAAHTATYAIRVPANSLQPPTSGGAPGGPLGEALQFNNPQIGIALPAQRVGSTALPAMLSIAATSDATAVISALKAGTMAETDMIVRIYQATNAPLAGITVNLDPGIASMFQKNGVLDITGRTALELPLDQTLMILPDSAQFTFTAAYALTTLRLSRD